MLRSRALGPVAALLLTVVASLFAMPSSVSAQSDDERARGHFLAARSYFDQRRYDDAAEQFREAYRLSHRPVLLINVSTSLERAGHFEEAAQALEEYLQAEPESEDRATLEERIRQLRAQAATPPEPEPEPEPEPTETPSAATGGLGELAIVGIVLASAGVALGAAAIGTGVAAADLHGSLESRCGPGGTSCPPGFESDRDQGEALAIANTVLTPISIAALGAGVVLFILGLDQPATSESAAPTARLTGGPGDLGLGASVSF